MLIFSRRKSIGIVVDFRRESPRIAWRGGSSKGVSKGELGKGFFKGEALMGVSKGGDLGGERVVNQKGK